MSGYRIFFECVICEREIGGWAPNSGPNKQCAPVCRYCEGEYTRGAGRPKAGSFADRRATMQIAALSEALRAQAGRNEWSRRYGSA